MIAFPVVPSRVTIPQELPLSFEMMRDSWEQIKEVKSIRKRNRSSDDRVSKKINKKKKPVNNKNPQNGTDQTSTHIMIFSYVFPEFILKLLIHNIMKILSH